MKPHHFRPEVHEFESRLQPSVSPTEVVAAVDTILNNSGVLGYVTSQSILFAPSTRAEVGPFLELVYVQDTKAQAIMNTFLTDIQTQLSLFPGSAPYYGPSIKQFEAIGNLVNADLAATQSAAGVLDVKLTLPPPPPPPPSTPLQAPGGTSVNADAGMTSVMPIYTNPDFADIGNGVLVHDVVVGSGTPVADGDSIVALYTLWQSDGTLLQTQHSVSVAEAEPFAIPSGVITGFADAVVGMKPGGIRDFFVPSSLGYGTGDLVFEVKLISVISST